MRSDKKSPSADVHKKFTGNLAALSLDMLSLKAGIYHIKGTLSGPKWQEACTKYALQTTHHAQAALTLEKKGPLLEVSGRIQAVLTQTCARTLEPFEGEVDIKILETLLFGDAPKGWEIEDMQDVILADGLCFNLADLAAQWLTVYAEAYPIHPRLAATERGAFQHTDEDTHKDTREEAEEKNPFASLKRLQCL